MPGRFPPPPIPGLGPRPSCGSWATTREKEGPAAAELPLAQAQAATTAEPKQTDGEGRSSRVEGWRGPADPPAE